MSRRVKDFWKMFSMRHLTIISCLLLHIWDELLVAALQPCQQLTRSIFAVATVTILVSSALGQTPTVQIANNTRGGSSTFYVGDTWTVTISGGAAFAPVVVTDVSSAQVGTTNGSGQFILDGAMSAAEIGSWNQTWSVGGVTASPNPLSFSVYPQEAATCGIATAAVPPVMGSLDLIDSLPGYLVFSTLGSGTVSGAVNPTAWCAMYGDQWTISYPISGQRTISTNAVDQWEFWDNGSRPLNLNGFYPYVTGAAVGMLSIN